MVCLWGQCKETTVVLCFLGKGSCKALSLHSQSALAANVNSWWVNLIWELVLHLLLQPLFFLVWAKRNKCFILIVQVPCLVWIVKPALWGHVFGCTSHSFPLHVRKLKYLVRFYLASVLYLRFVKNDYCVKEEKQDGLFQLTGHEIVISLNSTRSVNGTSMTHFSGAHRHFCNQCLNGRVGWGWKEMGWHPTCVQSESVQLPL